MKQKIFLLTTLAVALFGFTTRNAKANYMYGNGEPSRQIVIDKQVKPDNWSEWYDNISIDKYVFIADDIIEFKIVVKNSGEDDLTNVEVIDYLPDFVNLISAPAGYTQDGQEIKWNAGHFNPGEEKEYFLTVQVVDSEQLEGKGGFCITNKVQTQAETGEWDEDTAEICIESRILGATEMPEAGAEVAIGVLASLALAGIGALTKRRYRA